MKETVFKLERGDDLIDVMSIRLVERNEIEMFVLTQAIGVLELVERKVMLTSQAKKSVLNGLMLDSLDDIGADDDILELFQEASLLQGELLEVSDEVAQKAGELKERMIQVMTEKLKAGWEEKKEWLELYELDLKTIKMMHEETRRRMMELDDCK